MPIGVPRIIYCWGEELPAQWTDIYNFIFRRRMVFLMQYLDDELCNQICGLLINIHMEDRSKELEKKEIENSGLFKSNTKGGGAGQKSDMGGQNSSAQMSSWGREATKSGSKFNKSVEDLLKSEDDLAIDQNNMLEQYTLQKITMEWLNWNAQFFDYSDEPYLYYLADILSKDFAKDSGNSMYNSEDAAQNLVTFSKTPGNGSGSAVNPKFLKLFKNANQNRDQTANAGSSNNSGLADVYSPFRSLANFAANNYDVNNVWPMAKNLSSGTAGLNQTGILFDQFSKSTANSGQNAGVNKLLNDLAQQKLSKQFFNSEGIQNTSENALGQRRLKREYLQDRVGLSQSAKSPFDRSFKGSSSNFNYLDTNAYGPGQSLEDYSQFYRKQTERTIQEEESKKVFVIINSFGGSVGNGITVHDALQFIKAGSLTLGLGVAASAASLVLAGGTIGERYVTEGCHTMIHQPEGGLNGQASDIWIDANEIMKIRLDVAEIYSLSTYRPRHKILRDLDRDFYLTATETIQYGLADEIATNEVMHSIIEMTSKVWDFHDAQQQRLLETRESASSGLDTQPQN